MPETKPAEHNGKRVEYIRPHAFRHLRIQRIKPDGVLWRIFLAQRGNVLRMSMRDKRKRKYDWKNVFNEIPIQCIASILFRNKPLCVYRQDGDRL